MTGYVARRLLQAVGVLWAAFTVSFLILYLLPSDPVSIMLDAANGNGGYVDPAKAAELRAAYGFDKGPLEQYLLMLGRALTGDLGTSISSGAAVTTLIVQSFPETLKLSALALALSLVGGAGIATAAVWTRSTWLRQLLLSLPPVGVAVPTFWIGLLLQVFSFRFFLFPAVGNEGVASLVLPAVTLAIPLSAVVAQVLAESMQTAWRTQYVETALAKGASRGRVVTRHVARNAAIPALTILGVLVGNLLAGSVVVETVFSRAGFGRLIQTSVQAQDIPVVQGLVVVAALVFVLVNLAVDLAYPVLDPRITRTARTS